MSARLLFALWVLVGQREVARADCAQPAEPSLAVLSAAALRTAALEPARVAALLRRARVAALLPQLTVRVGKGAYDSIRGADTLDPTILSSDTLHWEVMARFSLDRLIFDLHELRTAEAAGRLTEHRLRLLERVAALWSERRDLREADAEADEACEALTALLDALTSGALTMKALPRPQPRR